MKRWSRTPPAWSYTPVANKDEGQVYVQAETPTDCRLIAIFSSYPSVVNLAAQDHAVLYGSSRS